MQDIHNSIVGGGAGGGRLFAGGGDRRLRPHQNNNHHHQALKCPRCDSLNTKFCYYNNYNLSQPRHFCKGCRRYWTKGGVLRNVPVGGGCRKTKRSKPKQNSCSYVTLSRPPAGERNSNSHSSSESSSLTATTTAAKKKNTGEVSSETNLLNFPDSRLLFPYSNVNTNCFDQNQALIDPPITSEGQLLTSLMTSSNDQSMLGFVNMTGDEYRLQQNHHEVSGVDDQNSNQMENINCGFVESTVQIGYSGLMQNRISNSGLSDLDWQINGGGGEQQGLFDFGGTVDQAYWSQNQWADNNDQSLNFPPVV